MMKKFFFSAIALLFLCATASAQDYESIRYQGEAHTGIAVGTGPGAANRYCVETVHGVRVGSHFFSGLGVGLDMYNESELTFVPVFLNLKGYLSKSKYTPYLSVDIGYGAYVNFAGDDYGRDEYDGGLYACTAFGMSARVTANFAVNFDLGYQIQKVSSYGYSDSAGAVIFRVGFNF